MGFFTLPLAELVGPTGRVIAVDIQPKMIAGLKRRAAKKNLLERIDARVTSAMGISDLNGKVDFTLAFAMVHELPDASRFFAEVGRACKPGAKVLLAEPRGHVKEPDFTAALSSAAAAGFSLQDRPSVPKSLAALLVKN
jgi:SAM-dependent methyltransferase